MHFFITAALILAYGLLLIFALLHVLQSLAPWLAMALEAGDERQDESSGHSTSYTRELGGNAHARVE
jgi:hypothetical protein